MSRKCFTIYVSVYNTHPPFRAQIGGKKVRIIHGERRYGADAQNHSTSKSIVDTAVAMASLDFNYGPTGYSKILEELDISSGIYLRHHILQSTRKHTSDAARHCTNRYKKLRKLKGIPYSDF